MKIKATIEFVEETLEQKWPTYEIFNEQDALVGRLYVKAGHLPPEFITLYLEEQDNE